MSFIREFRKKVIYYNMLFLELTGIDKKTLGFLIRAYHVNLPIYIIIFLVMGPKWFVELNILFLFLSLITFALFDGCFMSMIEQKLDGEDITIMDPFVEMVGLPKNNKSRMAISFIIGPLYIVMALSIYFIRFYVLNKQ